ncbi:MAG: hypothetical protein KAV87_22545 [Desulfobacteraceae bacterium]|nr:hypothetical protein [Desulfobacteraceae bacterium]
MSTKVTLRLERPWVESSGDEDGMTRLHQERARLTHALVDALDLEVKDWGDTDVSGHREVVEIIVALGSAGAFTAMASALKLWLERRKMKSIEIKGPKGSIKLEGATAKDVMAIAKAIGVKAK